MFLSRADLFEMTGYERPAPIKRWLTKNGFSFVVGRDGWPRVMSDAIRARLSGMPTEKPAPRLRLA